MRKQNKAFLNLILFLLNNANINRYITPRINTFKSFHTITKSTSTSTSDTNEININPLVSNVKISKTIEVFSLVKEMESEGVEVTSLCVGEPGRFYLL